MCLLGGVYIPALRFEQTSLRIPSFEKSGPVHCGSVDVVYGWPGFLGSSLLVPVVWLLKFPASRPQGGKDLGPTVGTVRRGWLLRHAYCHVELPLNGF